VLVAKDITAPHGLTPHFSLTIESGSFVGLVGPNGAGKTTLLRCLAGALTPSSGDVKVNQNPVASLTPSQRAKQIAYLPQLETAPAGYTVRDVVALGRYAHRRGLRGLSPADHAAVDDALKRMALEQIAARLVDTLSGGEYQRVRMARAFVQGAPILLLDEPVAHLDPGAATRLMGQVIRLAGPTQHTMIAALHDLNLAALYCSRLIMLDAGSIVADGAPKDVLTQSRIEAVYGEDCVVVPHPNSEVPQILMSRTEDSTR